jgi:hypothetical protein
MTTKKATLYINPSVHKLLKIKAAVADTSISDVTNDVLEAYFESSDEKLISKLKKAQREAEHGRGSDFEKVFGKL